jgi:hypothetical protein
MKALSEIYRLVKKGALNFSSFGCFSKISENRHFWRLSKMIDMVTNTSALTSWPRIYPQNCVWTIGSWVIPPFVFSRFKNQTCPGWGMARDPNVLHFDWTIYLRRSGSPHNKNNRFWSINAWAIHNWNFQLLRALRFLSFFSCILNVFHDVGVQLQVWVYETRDLWELYLVNIQDVPKTSAHVRQDKTSEYVNFRMFSELRFSMFNTFSQLHQHITCWFHMFWMCGSFVLVCRSPEMSFQHHHSHLDCATTIPMATRCMSSDASDCAVSLSVFIF